ncbi:MAG: RagB/SusD family nutrient uptake outer membrane protein, partial [Chitinophagaceae bacterium]
MKTKNIYKYLATLLILLVGTLSCTNLNQHVYSVVPNSNFWQTPAQIAAGIAPAYAALTAIPDGNVFDLNEITSDEMIVPTRGSDWYDNNQWQQLWLHTWPDNHSIVNGAWGDIYNGSGKANFTLSVVNGLANKPADLDEINAELKILRAYYYYLAMDL